MTTNYEHLLRDLINEIAVRRMDSAGNLSEAEDAGNEYDMGYGQGNFEAYDSLWANFREKIGNALD